MIFKTFKKLTRVPCPCIILLEIVQDRERPCETERDRVRQYESVYTTAHEVHSTKPSNQNESILYQNIHECVIIRAYLEQRSVGPYVNPVNVQSIE